MEQKKTIILLVGFLIIMMIAFGAYGTLSNQYTPMSYDSAEVQMAVDFMIVDGQEQQLQFLDLVGEKPVVLNFWASWCGPCKMEFPDFQKVYDQYGEDVNFVMVNLTTSQNESQVKAQEFIAQGEYTLPIYYDTQGEGAYGYAIRGIPTTYVINTQGEIVFARAGMMGEKELQQAIQLAQ